jgi:hypothetical protein
VVRSLEQIEILSDEEMDRADAENNGALPSIVKQQPAEELHPTVPATDQYTVPYSVRLDINNNLYDVAEANNLQEIMGNQIIQQYSQHSSLGGIGLGA